MKTTIYILSLTFLTLACGGEGTELDQKKEDLAKLKSASIDLKKQISDLQREIRIIEPGYGNGSNNSVLVSVIKIQPRYFQHKIEVRGEVESRTNVKVGPDIPGKIVSVKVKEGDFVKKGQVLLVLDNEITSNNIAELQTNLELATIIFEKRTKLWEKNIGTEIQYLEAKNNKETLERKLTTVKSQLKQASVNAPFSGTVDAVDAKVGEMAQPGMMLFRIVNRKDIRVKADISERFIGRFKTGDEVGVYFPSQDERIISTIGSLGQVINRKNRTFEIEVKLPRLPFPVRPNQVVVLNLTDYKSQNAFVLPRKLIQKDSRGNFVFELIKKDNQMIARKLHVTPGVSFDNETEITEGLKAGQTIAYEGYRELAEGVIVKLANTLQDGDKSSSAASNQ